MSNYLLPHRAVTITVAASDKLATYSRGTYVVDKVVGSLVVGLNVTKLKG